MQNNIVFFKRDLVNKTTLIYLILALLMGGAFIIGNEYMGGHFGAAGVIGGYKYIADIMLIYISGAIWGKEFQYRTINMVRISKRSPLEIILRKLTEMLVLALIVAGVLILELAFYSLFYHVYLNAYQTAFDLGREAGSILRDTLVYTFFIYTLSSIVTLLFKNSMVSFFTVFFGQTALTWAMVFLSTFNKTLGNIFKYVPFAFSQGGFLDSAYDTRMIWVILVWGAVLLAILPH